MSADTRAFLDCLLALGIDVTQSERGLLVRGCGGKIPNQTAAIHVQSAGTAARFLTVSLGLLGGEYTLYSSEQMAKRPMEEAIALLRGAGVTVECLGEENKFPFTIKSKGISCREFTVNTDKSTQYASATLLTAGFLGEPLTLTLTGNRTRGSYLEITLKMLADFGIPFSREGDRITVLPQTQAPTVYAVEPDISGACYFYALSLLLRREVLVRGVRLDSMQGDMKLLSLLEERGVCLTQTAEGVVADGSGVESFEGFCLDMQDFSDQTLTVSALACFATSPSVLSNVAHIRLQECDRIRAIVENINALGGKAVENADGVTVIPTPLAGGVVNTFDDHRVAMAFALVGLKTGSVQIQNPDCCKKTFENFFEILDDLE